MRWNNLQAEQIHCHLVISKNFERTSDLSVWQTDWWGLPLLSHPVADTAKQ